MSCCAMSQSNESINVNQFNVKQYWMNYSIFYAIKSDNKIVGNLILRTGQLPLMYELLDAQNKRLSRVDYSYLVDHDRFDIYDDNNQLLGATDEYLFKYFPAFYIYQANSSKPALKAEMNFWGTTFSIYDVQTNKKIAKMSRGFITNSYYWDFKVSNKQVFDAMNIDQKLLMTAVAIQTDPVLYETSHSSLKKASNPLNNPKRAEIAADSKQALERVKVVQQKLGLLDISNLNNELLEAVTKELDSGFINTDLHRNAVTEQEKFEAFLQYCLDKVESNDNSDTQKKAIIYLLTSRFQ